VNGTKHELASVGSGERRAPTRNCEICAIIKKFGLPEDLHDPWFCARPLKRAIERLLGRPLSNLTGTFIRETDAWESWKRDRAAA